MTTKEIATEHRLNQWAQALRERVANGESIKDFCQRKDVSRNTYFYWQRKLREAALELTVDSQQPSVSKPQRKIASVDKSPAPVGWALCEVAEPKNSPKALPIEIGKFRVMADADVDAELLEKVCRTLVPLC